MAKASSVNKSQAIRNYLESNASSPLNLSFFSRRHSEWVGGGEKVLPVDLWWSDCGGRDESLPGGKTRKINSTRRPEQVVHVLLQTSRRSHLE